MTIIRIALAIIAMMFLIKLIALVIFLIEAGICILLILLAMHWIEKFAKEYIPT